MGACVTGAETVLSNDFGTWSVWYHMHMHMHMSTCHVVGVSQPTLSMQLAALLDRYAMKHTHYWLCYLA